jgi:hypothetical protein
MLLADETPEADAAEQRRTVDVDDETGLDSAYVDAVSERDANQGDQIDQAAIVSVSEPIWQPTLTPYRRPHLESATHKRSPAQKSTGP